MVVESFVAKSNCFQHREHLSRRISARGGDYISIWWISQSSSSASPLIRSIKWFRDSVIRPSISCLSRDCRWVSTEIPGKLHMCRRTSSTSVTSPGSNITRMNVIQFILCSRRPADRIAYWRRRYKWKCSNRHFGVSCEVTCWFLLSRSRAITLPAIAEAVVSVTPPTCIHHVLPWQAWSWNYVAMIE